ncbi:hypothetical protein V6N12_068731 [Hibiscus sabdariffa]|uniref:Uncharacterized protein n=1 Tax=Hibiscus sabdariffa TaxID=183260 RepID=A0ABR2FR13_9ROSI
MEIIKSMQKENRDKDEAGGSLSSEEGEFHSISMDAITEKEKMKKINALKPPLPRLDRKPSKRHKSKSFKAPTPPSASSLPISIRPLSRKLKVVDITNEENKTYFKKLEGEKERYVTQIQELERAADEVVNKNSKEMSALRQAHHNEMGNLKLETQALKEEIARMKIITIVS